MENHEAIEHIRSSYIKRSNEWLARLKVQVDKTEGCQLTFKNLKDLYEVLERATIVARAAVGDQVAVDHIVFNKEDGLNIGMSHWAIKLLATSLIGSLEEAGGSNYLALTFSGHSKGAIEAVIAFKGKKTPADIAAERLKFANDLEEVLKGKNQEIEKLKADVERLQREKLRTS